MLKQSTAATKKLFAPVFETLDYAEDKFKTALIEYKQHADAEAAKLQAKQAEVARKKQEKLEAKAEALEAKGKHEQAAAARAEALTVAAPMISAMTPKLAGTSFKKKWVGNVTDAKVFYQAIAGGDIPVDAAPIDQGYINRQAGISQTLLNWPGVEVKEELVAATRAE